MKNNMQNNVFNDIRVWAIERGIDKATVQAQFLKLLEEVGELSHSIQKKDEASFVDAVGDCVVVLTIMCLIEGKMIEECIESAYNQIKSRKGKMVNGVFVKEVQ